MTARSTCCTHATRLGSFVVRPTLRWLAVPSEDPFFEVTRYGLGARGIDWIEKATVEDTSISFPIYDGHGNVIAQLGRTGSSYSLTQVKSYDVWGGVRSGALGPAGRYCGNLGHVSDDESGLIYMRARYYEPGSGRFISEDPAMDGQNWYAYCGNDPVGNVDQSGRSSSSDKLLTIGAIFKLVGMFLLGGGICMEYASLPAAINQILELRGEFEALQAMFRAMGAERASLKDELRFLKDAFVYKKNFRGVRAGVGGALAAFLGYTLLILGEEFQTEAAFQE